MKERVISLLKWSEKYTKTDMLYLFGGGFWLTFGQIVASASVLALSIAFANLVPKETYGMYRYVISVAGILASFTLAGFSPAIMQSVSKGFEAIMQKVIRVNLKWYSGFIAVALGISIYYFAKGNIELSVSMLLVAIFAPLISSFNMFGPFLNGKKMFKESTIYWGAKSVFSVIALIGVILVTDNILIIVATYFLANTIFSGIFYLVTLRKNKPNYLEDEGLMSYAKHLSLIGVLGTFASHIDKVLVFQFLGTVELAIYLFAIAIPEQLKGVIKQVGTLALPKFATRDIGSIRKEMNKKMIIFSLAISGIIILYILAAPFIYELLFPQYEESVYYSRIFALFLLGIANVLPMSVLQAKAETVKLYKLNIFNSVFKIIAMLIGLYFFGLIGLVISRIISTYTLVGTSYYFVMKE